MTQFQKTLIERIKNLSLELNEKVLNVEENSESGYVSGTISVYQFWIYDSNEGDFSSNWFDRRFEKYDYKSEEELIEAFVSSLGDAIKKKDHYMLYPNKSPPPLLNRAFKWLKTFFRT